MSVEHLTDEVIQAYLDGTLKQKESEVKAHLLKCSVCSEEVRMYRMIYSGIEEVETVEIPSGFAARVVSSVIPVKTTEVAESSLWAWLLGAGFGLVSVVTMMYFTDWKKIFKMFIDGFGDGYTTISSGMEQLSGSEILSNSIVPMVLFAGLLLALFGWLDYRLKNSNSKDSTLSCL